MRDLIVIDELVRACHPECSTRSGRACDCYNAPGWSTLSTLPRPAGARIGSASGPYHPDRDLKAELEGREPEWR